VISICANLVSSFGYRRQKKKETWEKEETNLPDFLRFCVVHVAESLLDDRLLFQLGLAM